MSCGVLTPAPDSDSVRKHDGASSMKTCEPLIQTGCILGLGSTGSENETCNRENKYLVFALRTVLLIPNISMILLENATHGLHAIQNALFASRSASFASTQDVLVLSLPLKSKTTASRACLTAFCAPWQVRLGVG